MDGSTAGLPVHHQLPELLKLMSIELVMPSNHLSLCRPLLLPPSIFPNIRVFSYESVLHIRWPKYWSFSGTAPSSSELRPLHAWAGPGRLVPLAAGTGAGTWFPVEAGPIASLGSRLGLSSRFTGCHCPPPKRERQPILFMEVPPSQPKPLPKTPPPTF